MASQRQAFIGGELRPETEAVLSPFDAAIATGVKAVEVSRTFGHVIFKQTEHINRLYDGADTLGITIPMTPEAMMEATQATLEANIRTEASDVDWQLIHLVSEGPAAHFGIVPPEELQPTVLINCIPLLNRLGSTASKYEKGADLVTVDQRAIPDDLMPARIKSSGRPDHSTARRQANEITPGSTGVLLSPDGFVTESTGSSLFIVKDETILTAPASRVLDGITRREVFDIAGQQGLAIEEADLRQADLRDADEAFFTSTVIGQVHARSIDGQTIGTGEIGPVSAKIRRGFCEAVGIDYVAQALSYRQRLEAIRGR